MAIGLLEVLERISSHRLLDRLIRGRIWLGLVTFALIGIVTLQLGMLKLNSGIGRSLEREGHLLRENSSLSIENSELTAGDRVEATARGLGMTLVPENGLRFLASHPHADALHAASALRTPVTSEAQSTASSGTAGESSSGEEAGESTAAAEPAEGEAAAEGTGEGTPEATSESSPESSTTAPATSSEGTSAPVESASAGGGTQAAPTG